MDGQHVAVGRRFCFAHPSTDWIMVGVTLLLVLLRLYARVFRLRQWTWSDFFVVLGWLFFVAQAAIDTAMWRLGFFDSESRNPSYDEFYVQGSVSDQSDKIRALKLMYAEDILYYFTMYCAKASLLFFYFEIITPDFRKTYVVLRITCVLTVVGILLNVFLFAFPCQPISTNWSLNKDTSCQPAQYTWALAPVITFHLLTDALIFCIPIPLVRALKIPRPQRLGAYFIFCVGFLDLAFAATVAAYYTSDTAGPYVISVFEQAWALIVVTLPSFKLFIAKDVQQQDVESGDTNSSPVVEKKGKGKNWEEHVEVTRTSYAIEVDEDDEDLEEEDIMHLKENISYRRAKDLETGRWVPRSQRTTMEIASTVDGDAIEATSVEK